MLDRTDRNRIDPELDELIAENDRIQARIAALRQRLLAEQAEDLTSGRHRRPQLRLVKSGVMAAPLVVLGWLRDQKVAVAASTAVAGVLSVPMALSPSTAPPILPADAAPPPRVVTPQYGGPDVELLPRHGYPPPVAAATGRGSPTPTVTPAPTPTPTPAPTAAAAAVPVAAVTVTVVPSPAPTAAAVVTPAPVLTRPEARQVCLDSGVLPVDLGACIAELVG